MVDLAKKRMLFRAHGPAVRSYVRGAPRTRRVAEVRFGEALMATGDLEVGARSFFDMELE